MVAFSSIISAGLLIAASANAAPMHQKRIAQVIADSTKKWVAACTKAGGADKCGSISQTAFTTLLAAGKNCDQQDAADSMVDLAKTLKNDPDMIKFAQLFAQQPRNAPDSLAVPYCQTAPKNQELNGFFHCQFQGDNQAKFSGDQTGNLPLGVAAVNPPGSCPASKTPIADGTQLTDVTSDPGTPQSGSGGAAAAGGNSTAAAGSTADNSTAAAGAGVDNAAAGTAAVSTDAAAGTAAVSTDAAAGTAAVSTDAAAGTAAVSTDAAAGTAAVSTDAAAGTAAVSTGAAAGTAAVSTDAAAGTAAVSTEAAAATAAAAPAAGAKPFTLQNGKDAQTQNAGFAKLTATSHCTTGQQACVGTSFAQCVGGKFQSTACAGGTKCFALPLVNKAGTSVTCSTEADATSRIAATGATGGITGA